MWLYLGNQLALLVPVVLGHQALAAEGEQLDEPVERLALAGRGLDNATKLGFVEEPQEVTTQKANSSSPPWRRPPTGQ
jgi:hypothetical protein